MEVSSINNSGKNDSHMQQDEMEYMYHIVKATQNGLKT
jgi:hypothetical protein